MVYIAMFKTCPMCNYNWQSREEFIEDPSLIINGYVPDFEKLEWSLFYFTHDVIGCGTTIAIEAEQFFTLYSGPKYSERKTGKKGCPGYCLIKDQLDRCDAFCECAFNREIIQKFRSK